MSARTRAGESALATALALAVCLVLGPRLGADLVPLAGAAGALPGALFCLLPAAIDAGLAPVRLALAGLLAGGIALGLTLAVPGEVSLAAALGLALTVGLIAYLAGALACLLAPAVGSGRAALAWVALALCLLAAMPVWLAPALDRVAAGRAAIDALIAASPLTHLAVPAGIDYLRNDWFYRHSPLGGMRYDYPAPAASAVGYLLLGALASWAAARARAFSPHTNRPIPLEVPR